MWTSEPVARRPRCNLKFARLCVCGLLLPLTSSTTFDLSFPLVYFYLACHKSQGRVTKCCRVRGRPSRDGKSDLFVLSTSTWNVNYAPPPNKNVCIVWPLCMQVYKMTVRVAEWQKNGLRLSVCFQLSVSPVGGAAIRHPQLRALTFTNKLFVLLSRTKTEDCAQLVLLVRR